MAESSKTAQDLLDSNVASTSQMNPQIENDVAPKQNVSNQLAPSSASSVHPDSDRERVKMQ